jgi:hypothetical protein
MERRSAREKYHPRNEYSNEEVEMLRARMKRIKTQAKQKRRNEFRYNRKY